MADMIFMQWTLEVGLSRTQPIWLPLAFLFPLTLLIPITRRPCLHMQYRRPHFCAFWESNDGRSLFCSKTHQKFSVMATNCAQDSKILRAQGNANTHLLPDFTCLCVIHFFALFGCQCMTSESTRNPENSLYLPTSRKWKTNSFYTFPQRNATCFYWHILVIRVM